MFQFSTHMELSRSMAAILEMPQYVAYQKNVVYAFIKLSAKSHSFNILCTMDGLSCPTIIHCLKPDYLQKQNKTNKTDKEGNITLTGDGDGYSYMMRKCTRVIVYYKIFLCFFFFLISLYCCRV